MPTITESNESTGLERSFGAQSDQQNRVEIVRFNPDETGIANDRVALGLSSFVLGTQDVANADLFCQRIQCARDVDNPLVFRVTATFVSNEFDPGPDGDGASVQDWNLTAQAKPKDVYRLPDTTTKPEGGNIDPNATTVTDIGEKGRLLLTGLSTRRVSTNLSTKTYDITFSFVYDEEFHLVQVAQSSSLRASGVAFGKDESSGTGPSDYAENAFKVRYEQPFPTLANFGALGIDIK